MLVVDLHGHGNTRTARRCLPGSAVGHRFELTLRVVVPGVDLDRVGALVVVPTSLPLTKTSTLMDLLARRRTLTSVWPEDRRCFRSGALDGDRHLGSRDTGHEERGGEEPCGAAGASSSRPLVPDGWRGWAPRAPAASTGRRDGEFSSRNLRASAEGLLARTVL